MATPVSSRPSNKNYLGNQNPSSTEVHDLRKEKAQCQISKIIRARHGVVFSPDTLAQAHAEHYDNCAWCIGGSRR